MSKDEYWFIVMLLVLFAACGFAAVRSGNLWAAGFAGIGFLAMAVQGWHITKE